MTENVKVHIMKVLNYYNYFNHPLLPDEVRKNFPYIITQQEIDACLNELVKENHVFLLNGFYSLQNTLSVVTNRLNGKKLAEEKLVKAKKLIRFINLFPFVDAVFISGSLSKYYANEQTDIDFFICTKKNKVWIARTILHLFKKCTFLVNQQHNFCMNYFIDETKLELEEKNIYTAIELVTLIAHPKDTRKLKIVLESNSWVADFLPNYTHPLQKIMSHHKTDSSLYQLVFNNFIFDYLNEHLMHITNFWWKRKWQKRLFPMDEYDEAFKSRLYVSKNHPANYQKKILNHFKNSQVCEG